jgi:hypothetical protein
MGASSAIGTAHSRHVRSRHVRTYPYRDLSFMVGFAPVPNRVQYRISVQPGNRR